MTQHLPSSVTTGEDTCIPAMLDLKAVDHWQSQFWIVIASAAAMGGTGITGSRKEDWKGVQRDETGGVRGRPSEIVMKVIVGM